MKIPHSKPTISQDDIDAVTQVLLSGMIAQGMKVKEFERALAHFIGRKYAIACSSGTSALHLALLCLKITRGDEVILPSYVCSSPYLACLYTGATPRLVDLGSAGFNIGTDKISSQKSDRTKAIIVPHMFGTPAELDEIGAEQLPIIEDCAQSVGAKYKGKMVGSYGNIAVFSFYATKMLTTGEGGMLLTDSQEIYQCAKDLREYDMKSLSPPRYNYKMTNIQAALGITQLRKLKMHIEMRKKQASLYTENLTDNDIVLPETSSFMDPVWYRYVIGVNHLEKIRSFARKEGVACEKPVFLPLHRSLGLEAFPNTERAYSQALSLPLYPSLSFNEQKYVIDTIHRAVSQI